MNRHPRDTTTNAAEGLSRRRFKRRLAEVEAKRDTGEGA